MNPSIELLLVAALLSLRSIPRRALRSAKRQKRFNESSAEASALSPMSTQNQMRALKEMTGPTTTREVEERLATIDEHGHRMTIIRTRTLETVLGPAGHVEIEHRRRHTLPGHGHVSQLSDTEFIVFHDGLKLRLDATAMQVQGSGGAARLRKSYEVSPASRLRKPARRASRTYPVSS